MKLYIGLVCFIAFFCAFDAFAGNPERSGQAGGTQLLVNPFARSSGVNGINVADNQGIESVINNPAGIAHTQRTEVVFAHCNLLNGAGVSVNTFGLSQSLGKEGSGGVIGLTFVSFSLGDIEITTIDNPDGGLGTFSPTMLNINLTYAKAMIQDRIFVGFTAKLLHESIPDVSSNGVAFDGGVQYRTKGKGGRPGKFGLGVALRNIGPELSYGGDGLTFRSVTGGNNARFDSKVSSVAATYELPSVLMIGASYRIMIGINDTSSIVDHTVIPMFTFVSNSFSQDQIGLGLEYSFRDYLRLRASYLWEENGGSSEKTLNAFTGLSAGATVEIPFGVRDDTKAKGRSSIGVDYSIRTTHLFGLTHAVGLRLNL